MQIELSQSSTSYYSLLANTVFGTYIPQIANLKLILCIVCRALGCFKRVSCERFALDAIQISTALARYIH